MRNIARRARKIARRDGKVFWCLAVVFALAVGTPAEARVFIDTEHHFKVVAPDNLALCTNHMFGATGPNHGPQIFLDVGAGARCPDINSVRSVGVYAYYTINQPQTLNREVADTCAGKTCIPIADPTLTFPGLKSKAVRIGRPGGEIDIDVIAITTRESPLDVHAILMTRQAFLVRDLDAFRRILATVKVLPAGEWCKSSEPLPWQEDEAVTVFEDCTVDMLSADGKLVLHVDRKGGLAVRPVDGGAALTVDPAKIRLRATFLWSPVAQMFAEGHFSAGDNLEMNVYRRDGARLVADTKFSKIARQLYVEKSGCGGRGGDPDTWLLGWSPDGKSLDAAAGPAEKSSCAGHPVAARLDMNSHAIAHIYTDQEIDQKYPREFWSASIRAKSASGH